VTYYSLFILLCANLTIFFSFFLRHLQQPEVEDRARRRARRNRVNRSAMGQLVELQRPPPPRLSISSFPQLAGFLAKKKKKIHKKIVQQKVIPSYSQLTRSDAPFRLILQ
jgi:hypothetical protein